VIPTVTDSLGRIRAQHGAKLLRFGAVSVFNVVFGQLLLYGAQVWMGWTPVAANTFSVCMGTIPGYLLSRRWVWERRGGHRVMREIIPFWALTVIGYAASTGAIWFVASRLGDDPLIINLTSLMTYGVLWVAKFLILDRMLFKAEEAPAV
jgi:putative flippase GtrA